MKTRRKVSRPGHLVRRGGGAVSSTLSFLAKPLKHIPVGAIVNTAIDALPIELHLPGGYQFCGPGTKLKQRLARGDPGINKLDQACKEHDIAYSKFSDSANRSVADRLLAEKAWNRVKSGDASVGERAAALAVAAAMKGKTTIGGGRKKRTKRHNRKRGGNLRVRRKRRQVKSGKKNKPTLWSMLKKGQGLYLRPYRVY